MRFAWVCRHGGTSDGQSLHPHSGGARFGAFRPRGVPVGAAQRPVRRSGGIRWANLVRRRLTVKEKAMSHWIMGTLAGLSALAGLFLAGAARDTGIYIFGLALFGAGILFVWWM